MKFYGAVVSPDEVKPVVVIPPFNILLSFFYWKNKVETIKEYITVKGYDVLIDSGAFSAENSKKVIDLDEYCKFLIETKASLYAGLDVIFNAKETFKNNEYMVKEYGLTPIPTFHLGSHPDDLYKLLDYPYIALGGMALGGGAMRYCDEVWSIILKERPNIRVHGFAMTNVDLMARYPWYSVDSGSFKSCRIFGRQQILWNGFNWKTLQEDDYLILLAQQGYNIEILTKKEKRFIYDFYSVQSYKLYGEHLKALNKTKDFSYLTSQQKLI